LHPQEAFDHLPECRFVSFDDRALSELQGVRNIDLIEAESRWWPGVDSEHLELRHRRPLIRVAQFVVTCRLLM
jgi:hypothetical protein